MPTYSREQFASTVASDFASRRRVRLSGVFSESDVLATRALEKGLGHPATQALRVGERSVLPMTIVFLDLTDFTGRSFWDDPNDVADLAHAVLSGFIETVVKFGGHALGLRGDGLFAGFGGDAEFATAMALGACAFALDAVDNGVNPWLVSSGIRRVQARAGVDAGNITFIRSGTEDHSEVNALGFAANFAAKCEKTARSWEVVVGQSARQALPDHPYFTVHAKSPKPYERDGERRFYHFYDFSWRRALPYLVDVPESLAGVASSDVYRR